MDKVTCIAFILYHSAQSDEIKEMAIDLLNGDVSLRELRKIQSMQPGLVLAETHLKKNRLDKQKVQQFAEEFLMVEA